MRSDIYREKRLALALEAASISVWDSLVRRGSVLDSKIFWTGKGMILLGMAPYPGTQEFRTFLKCIHPDDRQGVLRTMQDAVDCIGGYEVEFRVLWSDRSLHWLTAKAEVVKSAHGRITRTIGLIRDITLRKQAELRLAEQKELAEVTLGSIGDGVITTDTRGIVQYLNRVAEQLTGWSSTDWQEGPPIARVFSVIDEASGIVLENVATKCLRLEHAIALPTVGQLIAKDGRLIAIEDSASPIRSEEGRIFGVVIVFRDVSHERALQQQLSWNAAHDSLTGLINRREFELKVGAALGSAKHERTVHALLYIDLDQFKVVNDTCGHAAGDALLKAVSRLLHTHMREADIVGRLGGDEFGVLLLNCPPEHSRYLADEIRKSVKAFRFFWDASVFEIGVSIGMVEIDEDSKSLSELLSAADQACYMAKEQGRNRVHHYRETDLMLRKRHGQTLWVGRLHEALDKHQFALYAQPIMEVSSGTVAHAEVLLRMRDGDGGVVLPGAFIPAAERFDVMPAIDRWVIESVCRWLKIERNRHDQGPDGHRLNGHGQNGDGWNGKTASSLAINLSGVSLNDRFLGEFIREKFDQFEIDPARICFEITETAVINDLERASTFMESMKKLGCRFSLDDFGSGLSSFAYLKTLPVDYLKIDGLFIRDITANEVNHAMAKAINEIGHVMGMSTIAEFVETDAILSKVREIGIDYAQGFAVGPLDPLDLSARTK